MPISKTLMSPSKAVGYLMLLVCSAPALAQDASLFEEPAVKKAMAELEASLDVRYDNSITPGMALAMVHGQKVIWTKDFGYASLATNTPVTSNTIFRIGSITKLFTATMLMQLRDEGLLRLDQSVEDLMPVEIYAPFADPRPISFRQLVSHTSGFPPEGGDYWQGNSMPTIDQLYAENPVIRREYPPFSSISYSNFGVSVLGDILANLTGLPYEKYVADRILEPLGMTNTAFFRSGLNDQITATGYVATTGEHMPVEDIVLNALTPAGQVYSSALDMAKFVSLQFRSGAAGGSQILGGSSLREMHQPVFLFPDLAEPSPVGFAIGIGWFMREIRGFHAIGHGGGIPGYTSDITLVPKFKIGVVNLTNGGAGQGSDPTSLNKEILEKIIPAIAAAKRDRRLRTAGFDDSWEKYLGEYDMAGVAKLFVVRQGGFMAFVHPMDKPGEAGVLVPDSENLFVLEDGIASGADVRFEVDDTGKVIGLEIVGILSPKI